MNILIAIIATAFPSVTFATWGIGEWGAMRWGNASSSVVFALGTWGLISLTILLIAIATKRLGTRRVAPFLIVMLAPLTTLTTPSLFTFSDGEIAYADEVNHNFQTIAAEIALLSDSIASLSVPEFSASSTENASQRIDIPDIASACADPTGCFVRICIEAVPQPSCDTAIILYQESSGAHSTESLDSTDFASGVDGDGTVDTMISVGLFTNDCNLLDGLNSIDNEPSLWLQAVSNAGNVKCTVTFDD